MLNNLHQLDHISQTF